MQLKTQREANRIPNSLASQYKRGRNQINKVRVANRNQVPLTTRTKQAKQNVCAQSSYSLPYIQKGDIEDQGGEGLDRAGRAGAVTKVVRDDNLPAGTHRHLAEGSDPACDEFVEAESSGAAFLGLVEHLSVDELTYIMYCNETLRRWLRAAALGYLPVHHSIEHYLHSRTLSILLKELLIAQLIIVIYWWHTELKS